MGLHKNKKQPATGKRYWILYLTALLLIVAALWGAIESGHRTDTRMRRELVRQTLSIASALPMDEIQDLSFTIEDLNNPTYHRLCNSLKAYSETTGLKSIYTMALREDGKLVFGPESLAPNDEYASQPGDVYLQPSAQDFDIFRTGKPFVMGPFSDEYGSFVSASAPFVHPQTGKVLITIGIDIEATTWKKAVQRAQWLPLLLVLIPLSMLVLAGILMGSRDRLHLTISQKMLHHLETATCVIIMLLLTAGATLLFYMSENGSRTESFHTMSLLKARVYSEEMKTLYDDVKILANFFESSDFVGRSEFKSLCANIINHHAIDGMAWHPEVSTSDLKKFERQQQDSGFPDYRVKKLSDTDEPPEIAYPALYVEPVTMLSKAQGYDIYSETRRRKAIDEANLTGHATACAPIELAALPDSPNGFFIYQSVSAKHQKGILSFAVRPRLALQRLEQRTTAGSSGLTVCLVEINSGKKPIQLACTKTDKQSQPLTDWPKRLHRIIPLYSLGRTYALLIIPEAQWFKSYPLRNWQIALFAGLTLTTLLSGGVSVLTNRPLILEKKVAERTEELHAAKEYANAVFNSVNDAVFIHHPQTGEILDFNRTAEQMFGIHRKNIGSVTLGDLSAGSSQVMQTEGLEFIHRAAQGIPQIFEWASKRTDGRTFPVEISVTSTRINNEKRVIACVRNIEERKHAEKELEASRTRFEIAADAAVIGVWERDLVTDQLIWDNRMCDLYGKDPNTGNSLETWKQAIHPDDLPTVQKEARLAKSGKKDFDCEFRIIRPNGEIRYLRGIGKMLRGSKNAPSRMVGINYDITQSKQAEESLKRQYKELKRFNRAATGREMRMIELKKEINNLCIELGREEPYPLQSKTNNADTASDETA